MLWISVILVLNILVVSLLTCSVVCSFCLKHILTYFICSPRIEDAGLPVEPYDWYLELFRFIDRIVLYPSHIHSYQRLLAVIVIHCRQYALWTSQLYFPFLEQPQSWIFAHALLFYLMEMIIFHNSLFVWSSLGCTFALTEISSITALQVTVFLLKLWGGNRWLRLQYILQLNVWPFGWLNSLLRMWLLYHIDQRLHNYFDSFSFISPQYKL